MKTKLWSALIALYVIWGSTYLAIRFCVETLPPFLHAAIRFLISGALIYGWRRAAGDAKPTAAHWKSAAIVGTILLVGGNGLVAMAEKQIESGIAALIVSTSPFWFVLFESLRAGGTKPNWQSILGLIIGFGGVSLLLGPQHSGGASHPFHLPSVLLLMIAPMLWAAGSIYAKGASLPKSTILSTAMQMLTGGLSLLVVSLVLGEFSGFQVSEVSARSWGGLLYLITFGSLIGFVSYGWLLHNAPISLVSTYAYVNPVIAVFLGWMLAEEKLNARIAFASCIIVGSVILINYARQIPVRKKAR
ncbi:MAG: EamA family transporter [Kiritimatiellaceae bacterium]|nr:EamA family transporter [Kiritimatiellaceae bacterium]